MLALLDEHMLEEVVDKVLASTVPVTIPAFVPKAKEPPAIQRHVKLNVVLDDVIKRLRLPTSNLPRKKGKKGATFKGALAIISSPDLTSRHCWCSE